MITMTDSAKAKIDEICKENDAYAVSLNLSGGGCSGFKYDWGILDTKEDLEEDEEIFETGNGGRLTVGIISLAYLAGSEVDYISDLMGAQFEIKNPNATGGCGCGASVCF
jgi:iron-sulfur cluster assembly accessory protein